MSNQETYSDWALYKRLLAFLIAHKKAFIVAILGFAMYASSAPMMAHMMDMIENAYHNPTAEARAILIITILGIFIYRGAGSFLGDYYLSRVGRGVVYDLRVKLFDHLLLLPNSYYDNHAKGHIISKMTFDVEQVYGSVTNAITNLVREGLTVVFLLGYMFYMNWKLTLIFFAAAPFIALIVTRANKYFKKYSKKVQHSVGEVTQIAGEAINAYQEVKVFSGHEYEQNRFAKASDKNRIQAIKYAGVKSFSVPVMQFVVACAIAMLVWVALEPGIRGAMDFGQFMAYMTAASTLAKPMRTLATINALIQKGLVAGESIFQVLDHDIEKDQGTLKVEKAKGEVELKDLSFTYPGSEEKVLKQLNFKVNPGQNVALVGKSGSGKSTIISLLSRFYEYQDGDILLDGQPLKHYELDNLRRQIALVSQNVTLFNDTVYNNIAYGALKAKSKDEVMAAAQAAHALEFINDLPQGMDTMIGDDGVMLSGGQRQRLAIARAILKDAPILILDEATSALDTESERFIQEALENVMKNRTTFVVAHRLSTIEKADTILVINKGEIVERGSHSELLAKGGYYKTLHNMQFSA